MYSMKAFVKVIQRDFKNIKVKKRPQKKAEATMPARTREMRRLFGCRKTEDRLEKMSAPLHK